MLDLEVICRLSEKTHDKLDTTLYHRPRIKILKFNACDLEQGPILIKIQVFFFSSGPTLRGN